jgi:hypothetical protein
MTRMALQLGRTFSDGIDRFLARAGGVLLRDCDTRGIDAPGLPASPRGGSLVER